MTRKHFNAFAAEIRLIHYKHQRGFVADVVANVCNQFSSRFDRGRFMIACDVVLTSAEIVQIREEK